MHQFPLYKKRRRYFLKKSCEDKQFTWLWKLLHSWKASGWKVYWFPKFKTNKLHKNSCLEIYISPSYIYIPLFYMEYIYICTYPPLKWSESLSHVRLFATPWTVACPAPLSMGFSRQEYWSGLPFPSPGDLPNPGLPHCRQTLYRLSHQGSPSMYIPLSK